MKYPALPPLPPPTWHKAGLLCFLFIAQLTNEYFMESMIENIQDYSTSMAISIAAWTSVPAIIFSTIWCSLIKIESIKPPIKPTICVAVSTFMGGSISLLALQYVPYTLRIVSKSCKPVAVAIAKKWYGISVSKDKFRPGCCIIMGSMVFMFGHSHYSLQSMPDKATGAYVFGIMCLMFALTLDGITGAVEDKYFREKKLNPAVTMYNIHVVRVILITPAMLYWQLYTDLWLVSNASYLNFIAISVTSPISQLCLFHVLATFGAFDTLIITTVRKVFSISISLTRFNGGFLMYHWIGLGLMFFGMWRFIPKRKKRRFNYNYQRLMSMV